MRKLPSKEEIGEMISWTWAAFFFAMTWICFGIIAYGLVFQFFFRFLLADFYPDYHLAVFVCLWILSGLMIWLIKKDRL